MAVTATQRKTILSIFTKKFGLTLHKDAIDAIAEFLPSVTRDRPQDDVLEFLAKSFEKRELGTIVTKPAIIDVIQASFKPTSTASTTYKLSKAAPVTYEVQRDEMQLDDEDNMDHGAFRRDQDRDGRTGTTVDALSRAQIAEHFHVVDAFSIPRLQYSWNRKTFEPSTIPATMFASADAKSALFRDRYDIIKQRLLNNPLFRDASSFENENVREDQGKIFKLTPIPHISTTPPAHHVTLGMLTRMPDGRYHVEDPHASVPLEFPNKVARTPGVFTETAFVLVEGYWTGEVLRVETVGMPPGEGRAESDKSYKNIDFFGGPKSTESPERLLFLEKRLAEIHFVILSDLWLDQPKVLSHFRTLLSAYSTPDFTPPLAFLLCGPYSSRPYLLGASHFDAYREGFNTLADIIAEYPRLRESKFVFIPGPGDPWDTKVLPRARVPKTVTGRVEQKVPGAVFATNPCRMKYFTHEIVLYREDLATKLRRNCVVPPDEDEEPDAHVHLVQTVVAQSHLCPLPLEIRPVSWAYDAAMRVYPLPQTVILADRCDPYDVAESGSTFVNPGSFPTSGWSFVVYYPGSGRVQHSKIPN